MPSPSRVSLFDPLRDSNFYLFDVAPIDKISLPIFTPLFGFQSVSSPELTLETEDVVEGNSIYPTHVIKSGSVSPITLTRGVTFVDSDFWRWIKAASTGNTGATGEAFGSFEVGGVTYRRSLLLVHFFRNFFIDENGYRALGLVVSGGLISAATGADLGLTAGLVSAGQLAALAAWSVLGDADWDAVPIPARAFLLKDCIPTRYKMGSDYDANSGQISVAELEVQPHYVEEISLFA